MNTLNTFIAKVKELVEISEENDFVCNLVRHNQQYAIEQETAKFQMLKSDIQKAKHLLENIQTDLGLNLTQTFSILDTIQILGEKEEEIYDNLNICIGFAKTETPRIEKLKEDISSLYQSLTEKNKKFVSYLTIKTKHLSVSELEYLFSSFNDENVKFVVANSRICILFENHSVQDFLDMIIHNSSLYQKLSTFSQTVKFNGLNFNKDLNPLIEIM